MISSEGKRRVVLATKDTWDIMQYLNYEEAMETLIQVKKLVRRMKK